MALLTIDNLKIHFINGRETIKAVDGFSMFVDNGEIVALVGESGSGKSITALSILRLVPPPGRIVEGSIYFEKNNLLELSKREMQSIRGREIGLVLQDPLSALNPLFKSGEQIAEVLRCHFKWSRKKAKFEAKQLMERVQLSDVERIYNAYPHELSGGLRQRVLIAAALAAQPRLLIADEPTTALDSTIQKQILKLLKNLQKDFNLSILLITHDLGGVSEIADRVYVMNAGKIVESAVTQDLFQNPQHAYTKSLLDAMPKIELKSRELIASNSNHIN